jgi:hypothetical protein
VYVGFEAVVGVVSQSFDELVRVDLHIVLSVGASHEKKQEQLT